MLDSPFLRAFAYVLLPLLLALTAPSRVAAEEPTPEPPTFLAAVKDGEIRVDRRYRFEDVSEDVFVQDADAFSTDTDKVWLWTAYGC